MIKVLLTMAIIATIVKVKPMNTRLLQNYWYDYVSKAADKYGIPIPIILGVIKQESGGNPLATGFTGDFGLMQITKPALTDFNKANQTNLTLMDLFDPDLNITVGTWYLSYLKKLSETWMAILQKYNAGIGNYNKDNTVSLKYANDVLYYASIFAKQLNLTGAVYV